MESRIVIPDGMLKAAVDAAWGGPIHVGGGALAGIVLEAALRWLSENPIVPTRQNLEDMRTDWEDTPEQNAEKVVLFLIYEWQRRMFLAPEPEDDKAWVKRRYPAANSLGYVQVQHDGLYFNIEGIPGFRLISYLGEKNAWKAAREFIETGVQHACGRVVPPTAEVPEEVKDLWRASPTPDTKRRTLEAFHRGQKSKENQ